MAHLMASTSGLIRPYVDSLVRVFLKRLTDNNVRVSSNCLVALGRTYFTSCLSCSEFLKLKNAFCNRDGSGKRCRAATAT